MRVRVCILHTYDILLTMGCLHLGSALNLSRRSPTLLGVGLLCVVRCSAVRNLLALL